MNIDLKVGIYKKEFYVFDANTSTYLLQDLTLSDYLNIDNDVNGGYFKTRKKAEQAILDFKKKEGQKMKNEAKEQMEKIADDIIRDMSKDCQCSDIEHASQFKFAGMVYETDGRFLETIHTNDKKDFEEFLKQIENIGKAIIMYKIKGAFTVDLPVSRYKIKSK